MSKSARTEHVGPLDILDYQTFDGHHHNRLDDSDLKQFERFHAARHLISKHMDTYLDAKLSEEGSSTALAVDVCGTKNGNLTAVFCLTSALGDPLAKTIETINQSENANAVIVLPRELEELPVSGPMRSALENSKTTLDVLGWFGDTLEETFRETLDLIELLGNETRMKMLAPLLEKSGVKREYRAKINPKLVYHNISALSNAGILNENANGAYDLSPFGKTVLAEFITFLEKTRKALDNSKMGGEE